MLCDITLLWLVHRLAKEMHYLLSYVMCGAPVTVLPTAAENFSKDGIVRLLHALLSRSCQLSIQHTAQYWLSELAYTTRYGPL